MNRLVGRIVVLVGTLLTEGPIAAFIRSWSTTGAGVAWAAMGVALAALAYGAVATAGRRVSAGLTLGLELLALVMIFVHLVRAEAQRERERDVLQV